jgi:hypothetical protein
MVSFFQLLMPIFLAAVLVFAASSVIHMVFKWHKPEYRKLSNEEEVRAAVRAGAAGPGQYIVPYCEDPKEFQSEAMRAKLMEGPVGSITLRPPGAPSMGAMMGSWFALNVAVAAIAAYLACSTLPAGASFLAVCRLVGGVTFLAYGTGSVANAIWWGKPWSAAMKELLDASIYGLASALAFAWLWPRG